MKTMSKLTTIVVSLGVILSLTNCKKDNNTKVENQTINGLVQKGPFINGSSITVYDLQSDLTATGKSYNAQITDNKGTFQVSGVTLSSNFASLRADGFYFNEVTGKQSASQITLYALSDISGKTDVNINILTHLEKARVEYLIKNGKSFADAKTQAQKEVLAIFNIEINDNKTSETFDLSQNGDNNAKLLAVSAIIQGFRTESQMTELLSNISNDIKEDGVLSNDTLGSAILSQAKLLDTTAIKTNLAKRYSELGSSVNIPNFGTYISTFIAKTKFIVKQSSISYPETALYGANILSLTKLIFDASNNVSLAANPQAGSTLMIKITSQSIDTGKTKAIWYYEAFSPLNWKITTFDYTTYSQTFTSIESGKNCDLRMTFQKGTFLIEYFENNASIPTRSKTIKVDSLKTNL